MTGTPLSIVSICGRPDHDHAISSLVASIDDATRLIERSEPLEWDGPDHPSRSWEILLDGAEALVHEQEEGVLFCIDRVSNESGECRPVLRVTDRRLPYGWIRCRTPVDARTVLLGLLREWHALVSGGRTIVRSSDDVDRHRLPPEEEGCVARCIARVEAASRQLRVDETLDALGSEIDVRLRCATEHSSSTASYTVDWVRHASFDERTTRRILHDLPRMTWVEVRIGSSPDGTEEPDVTIAPMRLTRTVRSDGDVMDTLRIMEEVRLDPGATTTWREER